MRSSECDFEEAKRIGSRYRTPESVVFIVNTDQHFLSHRATWGLALQAGGANVAVIAEDTGSSAAIRSLGFTFIRAGIGRESGTSLKATANAASIILASLLRIRPQVVFLVHQAAYTVGWPAALLLRDTSFIRVAGGVGRALDTRSNRTWASQVVRASGRAADRLSNVFTLFQTEHDRQIFIGLRLLKDVGRSLVIPGTGIGMERWYREHDRDYSKPIILFASRLFREKGIYEFVEAARQLRGMNWRFQVAGRPDTGVDSAVSEEELSSWRREGAVEILGHRTDMDFVLGRATLFVLPTRHPEGTPKVLIEAGAAGLPAIVSAHPGCMAVVEAGVTGIVLSSEPLADELASAIEALASDPGKARSLGSAASERVLTLFSLEAVLTQLLEWNSICAVRRSA